jgi:transcriptional regulator with XRE-family HTH domain
MTSADFAAFVALCKERYGWTKTELAKRLGCGINQINIWSEKGAPLYIELACSALHDLPDEINRITKERDFLHKYSVEYLDKYEAALARIKELSAPLP